MAPALSVVPHVLLPSDHAEVGVSTRLVAAMLPLFFSVMRDVEGTTEPTCWLPQPRVVAHESKASTAWLPLPDRAADSVPAPVAIARVPFLEPPESGVKRAVVVQLAPTASVGPQVVETNENSEPVTEPAAGGVTDKTPMPVFDSVVVAVCAEPTLVLPKSTAVTEAD